MSEGLAHATSGALASAIAFSLLFPLDQLRLRRQCLVRQEASGPTSARAILRQVLREEGCAVAASNIDRVTFLFYRVPVPLDRSPCITPTSPVATRAL